MPTPERTSYPEILRAARALLEEGSSATVTMQAVAARVGVRAPSLYKRVRDRETLLADLASQTLDELTQRMAASSRSVRALLHSVRAYAHENPQAFRLIFTTAAPEDGLHRGAEPALRAVQELVGPERALDAARLVTAWVTGFIQMELAGAFRLGGDVERAFDYGVERIEATLRETAPPADDRQAPSRISAP